jgi:hypothetical protein
MKNKLFKFISKKSLVDDPILFVITENMIQEEAEEEIGRRLTEDELHDFVGLIHEDLEIYDLYRELMSEGIRKVVEGPDSWI